MQFFFVAFDIMTERYKNLEEQIRQNLNKAFIDKLDAVCSKNLYDANDVKWIVSLVEEIKIKLQRLTPNRKDLQDDIKTTIDLKLISQMVEHNAFDSDDFKNLVKYTYDILKTRCAPSQDKEVTECKDQILHTKKFSTAFPIYIKQTNKILDKIFDLAASFYKSSDDCKK